MGVLTCTVRRRLGKRRREKQNAASPLPVEEETLSRRRPTASRQAYDDAAGSPTTTVALRFRTCLASGCEAETQWSTCTNGAQTSPVAGAERERGHAPGELPGECRTRSALGVKRPSSFQTAQDPRSRSAGNAVTEYSPGWPQSVRQTDSEGNVSEHSRLTSMHARTKRRHSAWTTSQNLFGGWIRCRDTVVDVHERRSNEPCSGATGRV